jgi:hypothetical protein
MQFDGSAGFQPLNDPSVVNSQSFDEHQPPATQPVQFTLSGTGQLPQTDSGQGGSQVGGGGQAGQTVASGSRPGGGMAPPDDPNGTNDPWAKYKWWIVTALGLALVVGAGIMLKNSPTVAVVPAVPGPHDDLAGPPVAIAPPTTTFVASTTPVPVAASGANPLLQALKDELFVLEADRLTGKVSEAEYTLHKAAFDVVLRRALSRTESA